MHTSLVCSHVLVYADSSVCNCTILNVNNINVVIHYHQHHQVSPGSHHLSPS